MKTKKRLFCAVCDIPMQEVEEIYHGGMTLHFFICNECGEGEIVITPTLAERQRDFFPDK